MSGIQVLSTPTKSTQDVKDYKMIQLPNGLKALLISDTSYDLEKLDEEEAGEADDQSEEGEYQISKTCETVVNQFSLQHFHDIF